MAYSSHLEITRSLRSLSGRRRQLPATSLAQTVAKRKAAALPWRTVLALIDDAAEQLRVAYQGVPGAYSELAARTAYPDCATIACRALADAIGAVESSEADRAVLPVESTVGGCAVSNYDLLLKNDLHIVQEVNLFVDYCLLVMPGVKKAELRKVISHPMALTHCGRALNHLGLVQQAVEDTAGAGTMLLSHRLMDTAAVASSRAAALYGLDVLAHGMQDEAWNVTRFLILSKISGPCKKDVRVKTSIAVAYGGGALAALLKVLSAFSRRNVNLTKLEVNNPCIRGEKSVMILDVNGSGSVKAFPHVLYVDFEGSVEEEKVKDAIAEISGFSLLVRVLGCYTADPHIYDLDGI